MSHSSLAVLVFASHISEILGPRTRGHFPTWPSCDHMHPESSESELLGETTQERSIVETQVLHQKAYLKARGRELLQSQLCGGNLRTSLGPGYTKMSSSYLLSQLVSKTGGLVFPPERKEGSWDAAQLVQCLINTAKS